MTRVLLSSQVDTSTYLLQQKAVWKALMWEQPEGRKSNALLAEMEKEQITADSLFCIKCTLHVVMFCIKKKHGFKQKSFNTAFHSIIVIILFQ